MLLKEYAIERWFVIPPLLTNVSALPFDSVLSQQHFCQKLPKSVDTSWSYKVQHQCCCFLRQCSLLPSDEFVICCSLVIYFTILCDRSVWIIWSVGHAPILTLNITPSTSKSVSQRFYSRLAFGSIKLERVWGVNSAFLSGQSALL